MKHASLLVLFGLLLTTVRVAEVDMPAETAGFAPPPAVQETSLAAPAPDLPSDDEPAHLVEVRLRF